MKGENIVCFAKDWSEDPTSNNHVMKMLSQHNKVLWVNSISTRNPNLASGQDLQKIVAKLKSFAKGPRKISDNLWVYTPIVLPFPHSRIATTINRAILRVSITHLRRQMGMKEFQFWTFLPNAVEYVGTLGESMLIYYCTDEWSQFKYLDGAKIGAMEQELIKKADVVFATSRPMVERKKHLNPETHAALHGVDQTFFSSSLDPATPIAAELQKVSKPTIGFFGLLHQWRIDQELIAFIAERRPNWNLVFVGKVAMDVSRIEKYPNVHLLGRRPYETLPQYCKGFDIGIIPYVVNDLTINVNPIKMREYLSAGLPVVSTDLPEVHGYRDLCSVARTYDEFLLGIEREIASDSPAHRLRRSQAMKSETWEKKVELLCDTVMRVKSAKFKIEAHQPLDAALKDPWNIDPESVQKQISRSAKAVR